MWSRAMSCLRRTFEHGFGSLLAIKIDWRKLHSLREKPNKLLFTLLRWNLRKVHCLFITLILIGNLSTINTIMNEKERVVFEIKVRNSMRCCKGMVNFDLFCIEVMWEENNRAHFSCPACTPLASYRAGWICWVYLLQHVLRLIIAGQLCHRPL